MSNQKQLTTQEQGRLESYETVISANLQSFVDTGNALFAIREEKLYRQTDGTFEAYCERRWGFSGRHARSLMESAQAVARISEPEQVSVQSEKSEPLVPVSNERQARELAKLPPEKQKETWKKAVESAPRGKDGKPKVTAAHVKRVAEDAAPEPEEEIPTDRVGRPLKDKHLREAFEVAPAFRSLAREIALLKGKYDELCKSAAGKWATRNRQRFEADVETVHSDVRFVTPYAICPYCGGRKCDSCKQTGWMPEDIYKAVPSDVKGVA